MYKCCIYMQHVAETGQLQLNPWCFCPSLLFEAVGISGVSRKCSCSKRFVRQRESLIDGSHLFFLKLRQLRCLDTIAESLRETCSPGKFYSLHTRSVSTMVWVVASALAGHVRCTVLLAWFCRATIVGCSYAFAKLADIKFPWQKVLWLTEQKVGEKMVR